MLGVSLKHIVVPGVARKLQKFRKSIIRIPEGILKGTGEYISRTS